MSHALRFMDGAIRFVIVGEYTVRDIILSLYLFCLMGGMGVYLLVIIYHLM